jgi:hypothetical protein
MSNFDAIYSNISQSFFANIILLLIYCLLLIKKNNISKEEKVPKYMFYFFSICLLIIGIAVVYFFCVKNIFSLNQQGTFGDMYGALNAIFAGFAFAGIIITIIMQKEELMLTRKEMELTRKELEKSTVAQEQSQGALKKQLKNMELTTKMDFLNKYIVSISDNKAKKDEHYAANAILAAITEKQFLSKENLDIIKPIFQSINPKPIGLRSLNNSYRFNLQNKGGGATGIFLQEKGSLNLKVDFSNSVNDCGNQESIGFYLFVTSNGDGDFSFKLSFKDKWSKVDWSQNVILKIKNTSLIVTVEEPTMDISFQNALI